MSNDIDSHLNERLTLTDLAGVACLSPYHFSRTFKQVVGVSLQRYLRRQQVERTKLLMCGTGEPLGWIAQESGFCDQSYLTSVFRREGPTDGQKLAFQHQLRRHLEVDGFALDQRHRRSVQPASHPILIHVDRREYHGALGPLVAEYSGYTAIGTLCNLAARLCAAAQDGQILIGQRVAVAVEETITLEEIGALTLKKLT